MTNGPGGRIAAVWAAFAARAGRPPAGIWRAPGRVNLIGEHTDYNDGFALPLAIDRCAYVAAAPRTDGRLRCWSRQRREAADRRLADLGPGLVRRWPAYPLGAAWALRSAGLPLTGADVLIDSDVPAGAGLASSAALLVGVGLALTDMCGGGEADRTVLARVLQRAENEAVGAPTGIMDQLAVLLGRAGSALLLDCRGPATEHVPLRLATLGLHLLVIDSGVRHSHAGDGYGERRRACERAASSLGLRSLRDASPGQIETLPGPLLRRARHVLTENARVLAAADLLRGGADPRGLGPLLDASHTSLRSDFEVSSPELDSAVDAARAAGAIGARMTGGGFGGSVIALVPSGAQAGVRMAVQDAAAERGFPPPRVFPVEPADGARRVEPA